MSDETGEAQLPAPADGELAKAIAKERERKRTMESPLLREPDDPIELPRAPGPNAYPKMAAIMVVHGLSYDDALLEDTARMCEDAPWESDTVRMIREYRVKQEPVRQARAERRAGYATNLLTALSGQPAIIDTDVLVAGIIVSSDHASPYAKVVDEMKSHGIVYLLSPDRLAECRAVLHRASIMEHHGMALSRVDALLESIGKGGQWYHCMGHEQVDALREGVDDVPTSDIGEPRAAELAELRAALADAPTAIREPWSFGATSCLAGARLRSKLSDGEARRVASDETDAARKERALADGPDEHDRWARALAASLAVPKGRQAASTSNHQERDDEH